MNSIATYFATSSSTTLDTSALTNALTIDKFQGVIEAVLPIIGVAVLVGFLLYVVKWGISLFRGV